MFPEGTGSPGCWAIPGRIDGPDDAAFVSAVLTGLRRLGFSNGAGFAGPCAAARLPTNVPVVLAHGARDRTVPLRGGPVLGGALRAEVFTTAAER